MKNKEKFADKIFEIACSGSKIAIDKRTKELRSCSDMICGKCDFCGSNCSTHIKEWCEKEYVEYETDWSKVPVDTPVLVKDNKHDSYSRKRHFCEYYNNQIFCWDDGRTSFTDDSTTPWKYAELANEEDKIKYRKIKG